MPAAKAAATPKGLHAKMVAVMGDLDGFHPTGRNKHFRYDYWETNQISGIFRGLFVKYGLTFNSDVVDIDLIPTGEKGFLTTLKVLFTVTDQETGESISGHGVGQGDDTSDKGANKAFSGAMKYWLLKTFLLGGEDAESDAMEGRAASSDVKIESSNIEGIQRGGRSENATDVQVRRVRQMAVELKYGPEEMNGLFEQVLANPLDLPEDPADQGAAVRDYLGALPSDDMGRLIQYMEMMTDKELAEGRAETSEDPS
jgi:hypothetical protein